MLESAAREPNAVNGLLGAAVVLQRAALVVKADGAVQRLPALTWGGCVVCVAGGGPAGRRGRAHGRGGWSGTEGWRPARREDTMRPRCVWSVRRRW